MGVGLHVAAIVSFSEEGGDEIGEWGGVAEGGGRAEFEVVRESEDLGGGCSLGGEQRFGAFDEAWAENGCMFCFCSI